MNYYNCKSIQPYIFLPTFVGANSDFSRSLLLKNGFKSFQITKIEAHRFNYLLERKIKKNSKYLKQKNSILIITSIIPQETQELLEIFVSSKVKFDKIYIKEHPLLKVRPIIRSFAKNFPKFKIFQGNVSDAFELVDLVYVANGSSVLLESVIRKKKTVSLISLATLPIPALENAKNLYFVYNSKSLSNVLDRLIKIPAYEKPLLDKKNIYILIKN